MIPAGQRKAPTCAGGFTLLELLVVIGIIMIFLGLSIGAILRTPKVNALVATEHMIADVVRQARHAARSSGTPVVIELTQDDRTLVGVSQLMLWNETFENTNIPAIFSVPLGRTGKGLISIDGPPKNSLPPILLDKAKRLARKTAHGRTEGFYISCSVKPPMASAGGIIPLMMVGSSDEDQCTCGLLLQGLHRKIQVQAHAPVPAPGTTPGDYQPSFDCWEVLGWVNSESLGKKYVSSIDPANVPSANLTGVTRDTPALTGDGGDGDDVSAPLVGDQWEEIGMLYDGERLELYRNGVLVGMVSPFDGGYLKGVSAASDDSVHLGFGTFPSLPVGNQDRVLLGVMDDARLYRLAIDRAGTLPMGVMPQRSYRITVHPDGHVQASGFSDNPPTAPAATTDLTFTLSGAAAPASGDQVVTVSVSSDGVVSSATKTVP